MIALEISSTLVKQFGSSRVMNVVLKRCPKCPMNLRVSALVSILVRPLTLGYLNEYTDHLDEDSCRWCLTLHVSDFTVKKIGANGRAAAKRR